MRAGKHVQMTDTQSLNGQTVAHNISVLSVYGVARISTDELAQEEDSVCEGQQEEKKEKKRRIE